MAETMTKRNTKIVIEIGTTYWTGPRVTHVGYTASLAFKNNDGESVSCGHYGHRTTKTAIACARKMWDRLPKES